MIGYLLFLIARTGAVLIMPFGVAYTVIRQATKPNYIGGYFYKVGYVFDVLINVLCGDMFNDLFGKNTAGYKYGNSDETLSFVLGKNKQLGTLTKTEAWVVEQLNRIDPMHVEKAVKKAEKL